MVMVFMVRLFEITTMYSYNTEYTFLMILANPTDFAIQTNLTDFAIQTSPVILPSLFS